MPLPLMIHSALALFAQRTRIPTSARGIGFCVIGFVLVRVRLVRAFANKYHWHSFRECYKEPTQYHILNKNKRAFGSLELLRQQYIHGSSLTLPKQVFEDGFFVHEFLRNEAGHRDHRQAPVLELSGLSAHEIGGFTGLESQRIEANVARVVVGFEHPEIGGSSFDGPPPPDHAPVQLRYRNDAHQKLEPKRGHFADLVQMANGGAG